MKSTSVHNKLSFENVKYHADPFKHFQVEKVLTDDMANRLLEWLENTDEFIPRQEGFYRSSAFHLSDENVPDDLSGFFSSEAIGSFKSKVESFFNIQFQDRLMVSANRYVSGQGTLIHTDYVSEENRDQYFFTHRFLLYLNRGWDKNDGGVLGLFRSDDSDELVKSVYPVHNTGVGLSMGPSSFHAVSAINQGERYTLNFTFLSSTGDYEDV